MTSSIPTHTESETVDLVIVGAGVAGLSAALQATREELSMVIVDQLAAGGQCAYIDHIDNYPGIPGAVTGAELGDRLEEQMKENGIAIETATVESIAPSGGQYVITTDGKTYHARTVVLATGASPRPLGIPGESQLRGKGVSTCALCDGPFFTGKDVVVVGGGDTACDEALFLATVARTVTLIHRGEALNAQASIARRVYDHPSIEVKTGTVVEAIGSAPNHFGIEAVAAVTVRHLATDAVSEIATAALFPCIGTTPNTELVPFVERDADGYVVTDDHGETSVPGIFAVGDVRRQPFRQLIVHAAGGVVAAHAAAQRIRR